MEKRRLYFILNKERTDKTRKVYCMARIVSNKLIASSKEIEREKLDDILINKDA